MRPAYLEVRPGSRTRILVEDDDDDVRLVAAAMIEELGYEVAVAATGEAALKALAADDFALLLTDVAMPGMNGVQLAARARDEHSQLPIVFATGYADLQTFGTGLSDERLLKKPYRIAEVAAMISETLADRRLGGNVVDIRRT